MSKVRCPLCGQSFDSEQSSAMPFCGERCRMVDLQRWLDEGYALPNPEEETPEDDESESPNGD